MSGKPNRHAVQNRKEKRNKSTRCGVQKDKHKNERINKIPLLSAKTVNQKHALQAFVDKQLICLSGSAGCGKTTLAVWWACKQWLEGNIDTIVLTRGEKGLGETPPVPGNDTEKMMVMCLPMLLNIKKFLGVGILRNNLCMVDTDILFKDISGFAVIPMAKLGGMSFNDRTIIIADEQQASTPQQIKALSTRAEEGCQLIITGDTTQSPLRHKENGLEYLERVLSANPYDLVEVVKFIPEDNLRRGVTSHLTRIFEQDGQW